MSVENKEIDNNSVDFALNKLGDFSEGRFRIAEFCNGLNEDNTNQICKIFDNAFNFPQNNIA